MNIMSQIAGNRVIGSAVFAWFIASLCKVLISQITYKKFDFRRFVSTGGMPSSHSAFVVSLATAVGLTEGFDTPVFAVSFVLALVVMSDAAGVRRAAGKQAQILNKILENFDNPDGDENFMNEKLKELLGHTPFEVLVGALIGILIAVLFCS